MTLHGPTFEAFVFITSETTGGKSGRKRNGNGSGCVCVCNPWNQREPLGLEQGVAADHLGSLPTKAPT